MMYSRVSEEHEVGFNTRKRTRWNGSGHVDLMEITCVSLIVRLGGFKDIG